MVMVSPVPRRVPVIAPMVVSLIIMSVMMGAVEPPAHHDGSRYAEAHGHTGACVGRLGWHEQRESQECDYTTHTYDMFDTFHCQFLPGKHCLCAVSCSVRGRRLPHVRSFVAHASRRTPERKITLISMIAWRGSFPSRVCSLVSRLPYGVSVQVTYHRRAAACPSGKDGSSGHAPTGTHATWGPASEARGRQARQGQLTFSG